MCWRLAAIGWARVLIAAVFVGSSPIWAAQLMWHEIQLDSDGKLVSWVEAGSPYDRIIRNAWQAFKVIPVQANGYQTYFTYPTFYGPNDPAHAVFSGRPWVHHPAGLFAMLTDSALLYRAYSGDEVVLERVRAMLDHCIDLGTTKPDDAWAEVPYACADAGNPLYRGATDTVYCDQENHAPCGRGDGVGFLEPDKVGELGFAYLQFYEATMEKKYLRAALRCADGLAQHVRPGDESHSPWPFRVDAKTGLHIREEYSANTIGPLKLLDELLRLKEGRTADYRKARDLAWRWLLEYPIQNQVWTQYFEDVLIYADYRVNRNQYSPLETARYLLLHPGNDPEAKVHAKRILDWVTAFFASDSKTMAGVPEKGRQWGAEVISEQVNDMDKMASHTARYASVLALWYEVSGDLGAKERAFRSFNWATYASRDNGLVKTSLDEGTGYWFSDGYGDYMRHFLRGMASVPEWAPPDQNHQLGGTSVVKSIHYADRGIQYSTFDQSATEVFKLRQAPSAVRAGKRLIRRVSKLQPRSEGYTVDQGADGSVLVRISHKRSGMVELRWEAAAGQTKPRE